MVNHLDETSFRILDVVSRRLGHPLSINKIKWIIEKNYGTAHYVNIYNEIKKLEKAEILNIEKSGKSSIVSFNFKNYLLIDMLTEMELKKKYNFLKNRIETETLFRDLDQFSQDSFFIKSVCLISPEKNFQLNRVELLILLRDSDVSLPFEQIMDSIHDWLKRIKIRNNIKIDYLVLDEPSFQQILELEEINPVHEMLFDKIIIISPQSFWREIREILEKGSWIKTTATETQPIEINEHDMLYNLVRFGYSEFGQTVKRGRRICIEYIVISILLHDKIRRIEAIPVILMKNKFFWSILAFLSEKYGVSARLLGLLNVITEIKPKIDIVLTLEILKRQGITEIRANKKSIERRLRLYNVI
jgi:hypothetical protein